MHVEREPTAVSESSFMRMQFRPICPQAAMCILQERHRAQMTMASTTKWTHRGRAPRFRAGRAVSVFPSQCKPQALQANKHHTTPHARTEGGRERERERERKREGGREGGEERERERERREGMLELGLKRDWVVFTCCVVARGSQTPNPPPLACERHSQVSGHASCIFARKE